MIRFLNAFKTFLTATTTTVTINADRYTRHLAFLAFIMTSAGTLYFSAENVVKELV